MRPGSFDFPNSIALSFQEDKSVWRLDPAWTNHLQLASGGLYKLAPQAEAGGIQDEATFEFAMQDLPGNAAGWISPLHLRCECNQKEPANQGSGQNKFWQHVLKNDDAILDLVPEFPSADNLRVQFYLEAARQLRGARSASAVQRLVFGPNADEPNPLWFLILDGLNGEFRLEGFPATADSAEPKWIWLQTGRLTFFQEWLAGFACRKAGLDCRPSDASESQRSVPPNNFKNVREVFAGRKSITLLESELTWKRLGMLLEDEKTKDDKRITWQQCLADSANAANMDVESAIDGFLSLPGRGTEKSIVPGEVACFLSARHVLPRSPVRVVLPSVPACLQDMDRDDWEKNVTEAGLLDLVKSVPWPEQDWPAGLVAPVEDRDEPFSWNALSTGWHWQFHDALYQKPFATRLERWEYRPRCVLGKTPIKSFRLGTRRPGQQVYQFDLP